MKDRSLEQSNIDIISLDLGSFVDGELPSQIIDVARGVLDQKTEEGKLRGAFLQGFGRDLHMHLSTYNGDLQQADSLTVSGQAALAADSRLWKKRRPWGWALPRRRKSPVFLPEPGRGTESSQLELPVHGTRSRTHLRGQGDQCQLGIF